MSDTLTIDPSKIIEASAKIIEASPYLISAFKSGWNKTQFKVKEQLNTLHTAYLQSFTTDIRRIKLGLISDATFDLESIYVALSLEHNSKTISQATITKICSSHPHCIIEGTGGAGKSTLAKHLALSCIRQTSKVPIFIELRNKDLKEHTLLDSIQSDSRVKLLKLSPALFTLCMEKGHFCIFLDGLDEVDEDVRPILCKQIDSIQRAYPNNYLIITSRRMDDYRSWPWFSVLRMKSLTKSEAIHLLNKIPYNNKDTLNKFKDDLNNSLYKKHSYFLSNPLLLTIMLITYGQSGQIPDKTTAYFQQAYEALFSKHDINKEGFKRRKKSSLDINEFANVFAHFSMSGFLESSISCNHETCIKSIRNSLSYYNYNAKPEQYLDDCLTAVCLLVQDGLMITYTHRTFQEFFSAKFITQLDDNNYTKITKDLIGKAFSRDISSLLRELDEYRFMTLIVLPIVNKHLKMLNYSKKFSRSTYLQFLTKTTDIIGVTSEGGWSSRKTDEDDEINFIMQLASKQLKITPQFSAKNINWNDAAAAFKSCRYSQQKDTFIEIDTAKIPPNSKLAKYLYESQFALTATYPQTLHQLSSLIQSEIHRKTEGLNTLLSMLDHPY